MYEQELTRHQARELNLPPRNPFDNDDVIWGTCLSDAGAPGKEFSKVQAILGSEAA
jgi:hypothetical protein